MVRPTPPVTAPDFLQRKLNHYNQWLLDPARAVGSNERYPGFPEEVAIEQARAKLLEHVQAKKKVAAAKPKAVRARKTGNGVTRQSQAVDIYNRLMGDKPVVIAALQSELGMSLAGASTYFYNAKKLAV